MKYGEVISEPREQLMGQPSSVWQFKIGRRTNCFFCARVISTLFGGRAKGARRMRISAYDRPLPVRRGAWVQIRGPRWVFQSGYCLHGSNGHRISTVSRRELWAIGIKPSLDTWFWVTARGVK